MVATHSLRGAQTAPSSLTAWPSAGGLPAAVCVIASQPACLTALLMALPKPLGRNALPNSSHPGGSVG